MRDRYNLNQLNGSEHELPEFGMYIFNPWNKKTGHSNEHFMLIRLSMVKTAAFTGHLL